MKTTVYNRYNAPRGKAVAAGEEIYTWEARNDKGEIVIDSKNVKEEINSYLPLVDYKKQIARGELELNGNSTNEIIRDFTGVSGDTVDIVNMLAKIASMDKEQIDSLVKSLTSQDGEITSENKQESGEVNVTTPQTQSNDSANTTEDNGGSN
jgi:hypothetical protein